MSSGQSKYVPHLTRCALKPAPSHRTSCCTALNPFCAPPKKSANFVKIQNQKFVVSTYTSFLVCGRACQLSGLGIAALRQKVTLIGRDYRYKNSTLGLYIYFPSKILYIIYFLNCTKLSLSTKKFIF